MLVRAETGEDVKTLLARALNELFRAHKVPVVDRPEPKDSPMTAHLRLVGPDLEKRTVAKGRPAGRRPNHELRFAQRQVRPHGATGLRWTRVAV